jgi:hypothetical protein
MTILLVNVSAPSIDTSLDGFSHNFVYDCGSAVAIASITMADYQAMGDHLKAFWDTVGSGATLKMVTYLAKSINFSGGLQAKWYDITSHTDGSVHGPPVAHTAHALSSTPASTSPMPEGVAAVLGFNSDYGGDPEFVRDPAPPHKVIARPRMMHRGRFYVGPLNPSAMIQDSTTFRTRLSPTFCADLIANFLQVKTIAGTAGLVGAFRQWSKKSTWHTAPVVQCTVDDRPDYQRLRSDQSSVKTVVTVPPY